MVSFMHCLRAFPGELHAIDGVRFMENYMHCLRAFRGELHAMHVVRAFHGESH